MATLTTYNEKKEQAARDLAKVQLIDDYPDCSALIKWGDAYSLWYTAARNIVAYPQYAIR